MHFLQALSHKFAIANTQYVYHFKSPKFKGTQIHPLSQLQKIDPTTYAKEIDKYQGREEWINRSIPPLNCQARDTVNLSTINPIKLFLLLDLLDVEELDPHSIFKLPVSTLKNQEMVLFSYDKSLDYQYVKITPNDYTETQAVPPDTIEYYLTSKQQYESPLVFEYVPHILVKGSVDISKAEVIDFDASDLERVLNAH